MTDRLTRAVMVTLALIAAGAAAQEKRPAPTLPPLPPAVIDDTLLIGGTDIEAKKVVSRMTVPVQLNGQGPFRFVVDSGADTSVVGVSVARSLQLPGSTPVTLHGMTGSGIVERVKVGSLGFGQSAFHDLDLPVLREGDLGGAGMIGIDALVEQRLMLDFERHLIKVEDATRPAQRLDGEIVVTARRRRGQLILTEVRANNKAVEAVIDTGSEVTIGNTALRDLLIKRYADRFGTGVITDVTGRTMTLQIARIDRLRLGPVLLENIPIAFADVPPFAVFGLAETPALLLGTDLMETFRRVSLDFRARKVRFQLRHCNSEGVAINTRPDIDSRLSLANGSTAACVR